MNYTENILKQIGDSVRKIIPDAKVFLFGSRAGSDYTKESDWDILVISDTKIASGQKDEIRNILYNITLEKGAYFDLIFSYKEEWENTGKYYSLQQSIGNNLKLL
jgi:uncharacterized protein